MKKRLILSIIIILSAFQFGCATGHQHSIEGIQVVDKIPEGVRVRIGSPEIKEGDRVGIFRKLCKTKRLGGGRYGDSVETCSSEKVGEASVIKVLDHDSAVVQPDSGIKVESTMLVEKI